MRRVIPGVCLMLLAAGFAMAGTAENTLIPDQTIAATTVTFGPFNNLGGTNKDFQLSGSVDIASTNTDVEVRVLWNAAASSTTPTASSQWFKISYPASGVAQTFDTGHKLLLGQCPLTVWVEVRTTKSINTHTWIFGHNCNVTQTTQELIMPSYSLPVASPLVLLFLGLALATVAGFVLYRSRRAWSASGNA